MDDARTALDRLIREKGEDYASLSRLIGRNSAYIQQFIRRGSPRKLDEEDRRTLARYFGVEEALLGGPAGVVKEAAPKRERVTRSADVRMVPRFAIGASAGPGALVEGEEATAQIGFEDRFLRSLSQNPARLSMISVAGESMAPTLYDGDEIMVDTGDTADRLRDGIYVLRFDDVLMVKRLALNPATRRLSIRSDNPAYPDWEECDPAQISVIGRVNWVGRKLR